MRALILPDSVAIIAFVLVGSDVTAQTSQIAHPVTVDSQAPATPAPGKSDATLPIPPPPPPIVGCYKYSTAVAGVAPRWEQVACLTQEELVHVPHPVLGGNSGAPGILSQPTYTGLGRQLATAGLGGGAVTVSGGNWLVVDSAFGPGAYSVQLNSNIFSATCHASNPNPGGTCVPGDNAAVQFTYQTYNAGHTSVICVWNVDVTKQLYYKPQTWQNCQNVAVPASWKNTTLNISSSIDFTHHTFTVLAALPWTAEWDSVVAPDWYGLCWTPGAAGAQCAWTQDSGTILGAGNGSVATFAPGTSIQTIVEATAACVGVGCNPAREPFRSIINPYNGATALGFGTVETNSLTTYYFQLPSTVCAGPACTITYTASNINPN